ncbi:hypothetical protein N431DRAFT_429112 [Stipitochalara longipes BDJ]|nr:hypothetical protein N431DRAFT_429112 [Stipitochalara longipes BDJ]
MTALSLLAPRRVPVLRAGRATNQTRGSNLEAELGQFVGQVQTPGCTHCARGFGVWTVCVAVPGFLNGSCANCHYGSEGKRCSLRKYIPIYWSFSVRNGSNGCLTGRVAAAAAAAAAAPAPGPAPPAANPAPLVRPSRPLRRVAPVRRIVDRVAPRNSKFPYGRLRMLTDRK